MAFLGGDSRSSAQSSNTLDLGFSPTISVLLGSGATVAPSQGGLSGGSSGSASSAGNDSASAQVPFLNGSSGSMSTPAAPTGTYGAGQVYTSPLGTATTVPGANTATVSASSSLMWWLIIGGGLLFMLSSTGGKHK